MSEEQSQSVQNQPKEYVERPMVEKPISTEVATESQEAPIESPDFGQLIQDSKKYRKRAQESELALDKLNKKIESSRQKQLEEQNEWQTLAEERFTRLQEIEPMVEQFQKEEANQREMILADLTESDREVFGDLPLPKLRVLHSKLINNDKSVASTSGTPARSVNPSNKNWTEMSKTREEVTGKILCKAILK